MQSLGFCNAQIDPIRFSEIAKVGGKEGVPESVLIWILQRVGGEARQPEYRTVCRNILIQLKDSLQGFPQVSSYIFIKGVFYIQLL